MAVDVDLQKVDKQLKKLLKGGEKDTAKKYAELLTQIKSLLADQFSKYEKDGKLSLQDMLKFDRLKKMIQQIEWMLQNHYKATEAVIEGALSNTYSTGYTETMAAISAAADVGFGNIAVPPETLTAMLNNPIAGLTLNERLEKQRASLIHLIQREVTQGFQKNETYGTMAKRLKAALEGDAVKAMRIVRTEGHRVQESAKFDAAKEAESYGIIQMKQWNTLEDERVRPGVGKKSKANHRKLNNKKLPLSELFDDGLSKGQAPGQLPAAASSINCRCFLTYSIERIEGKKAADPPKLEPKQEPKQTTAADMKNYDELAKFAKEELKVKRFDLNNIPFDVAQGVTDSAEKVFKNFPFLSEKISLLTDTDEELNGAIGFQFKGMVFVNEKEFSYKGTLLKNYEDDVKANWHPKGTNGFGIVTHELGHSLEWIMNEKRSDGEYYSGIIQDEVLKNLGLTPEDIGKELSDYGASDPMEFFAEAFLEWQTAPQPRRVAKEFGNVVTKHIKELGLM
jgi:hypothetical protein